jgi:hypothetical protein
MTREDRWIVTLSEITALRWRCPKCHVAVSYALDESVGLPRECPGCRQEVIPDNYMEDGKAVQAFVATLKRLRRPDSPVTLLLEFLAPPGQRF